MSLKTEKGQAIVEFTVGIVAIMVVFLGVMFAYSLGKCNVEGIIEARGQAESNAAHGILHSMGEPITSWSAGKDERLFTNDDVPKVGGDDHSDFFAEQLANDQTDLTAGLSSAKSDFAEDVKSQSILFLKMADMTSAKISIDPYDNSSIEDLRGAFQSLIYSSEMTVDNTVYMSFFYTPTTP